MIQNIMKEAIELAKSAKGFTHPNPRVGAIVFTEDGKILGRGYHKQFGKDHAEVDAIKDALSNGHKLKGASICVTLEPCNHYGKTEPCTKAIIENEIKKIYIGTIDDNNAVCGGGIDLLKQAGITVETKILEEECLNINPGFHKYNRKKIPYTNLKIAISMDGKIGKGRWFTGEKAREYVHNFRLNSDFILTGLNTILNDNPRFTARINDKIYTRRVGILDTELNLLSRYIRSDLNVMKSGNEVFVITAVDDIKILRLLDEAGIKYIVSSKDNNGKLNMQETIKKLGDDFNIREILIEGGSQVMTSALKMNKDYLDTITFFIAPIIFGRGSASMFNDVTENFPNIKSKKLELLDNTVMLQGEL